MNTHTISIVPAVGRPGKFEAWLGNQRLAVSRTPLASAARVLLKSALAHKNNLIAVADKTGKTSTLRATVGYAAGMRDNSIGCA